MGYIKLDDEFDSCIQLDDVRSIKAKHEIDHSGEYVRDLWLIIFYWPNGGSIAVNYRSKEDRDMQYEEVLSLLDSVHISLSI